ncbi:MAG: aromatic-ring-hydroxylating dioxygenase subunit beta [Rhodospirillaceae bacterium]|jgi:anthranilate 1,2-dioxygenase small subunit|nr:aromatic-ring-hydroxylating dioxygenase subunit beta [Rhodospirillaceae bacterium]MBT5036984.1 aromatic-ring-hydroxylating dioxygenase subunit beta [Rhodospirillaceae bacterium]MBT5674075.1 aromatic-ring-hydroxylating dioxygenase subunit beta [Rhodospirillaceae bacterium]MBT5781329.1 aromatic-ring-hydroxylating dioxygenase subunit beta [Rhodospirillaceae bacterium]MBT6829649.1 aromatic-ring-hydroxylating dioxygenase subunit beta [Rhodospirillaceae bacterium]
MIKAAVRDAINDLLADYCHFIDDDRLEEWLDFFTEDCVYKILSRENEESGLPLELLSCRNKNMLRDRILSLREANIYNIHFDKHLLGAVRILGEEGGDYRVQANYSVYQSNQEGVSELFSVGTYRDLITFADGKPLFKEKIAVADTFGIPRLLSTPI